MSPRWLILLVATLVALVAVFWLSGRPDSDPVGEGVGEPVVPALSGLVNEIDEMTVTAAGGEVVATLKRDEDRWQVVEKQGFEADFAALRTLLRDLSEASRVEAKTANPEWYGRLGVSDVSEPDAIGARLDFPGTELPGVIVGKTAPARTGQYVRLADDERSWLVDRALEVPGETVQWLSRSIMDIPAADIASVLVRHPDGGTVRIESTGEAPDSPFVLMNVPEGREAGQPWRLRGVANSLAGLQLQDVRRFDESVVPEDAVRALFTTVDGLNFVATLFGGEAGKWVHFRVNAEVPAMAEDEHLAAEDSDTLTGAVAVDDRLSPWLYRISDQKFETMTRTLEDLLAPVEEEEEMADDTQQDAGGTD